MNNVEKKLIELTSSIFESEEGFYELQEVSSVPETEVARLIYYLSKYLLNDSNLRRCISYAAYLKTDNIDDEFVRSVESSRVLEEALELMNV